MNILQEMKEVKLRYLASVMNDYAEYLRQTSGNDYVANQIDEWANEIIDVIEITDEHPVTSRTLNIMKVEKRQKFDDRYHIESVKDNKGFQECMENEVVKDLLMHLKDAVKVRTDKEYGEIPVVVASIYVGVPPEKFGVFNELVYGKQ